ncbi:MAG TPA: hypothetical protein PLU65_03065 [Dokdonella sp.]|nr:hypothetical protein [Dokdonella sp.]
MALKQALVLAQGFVNFGVTREWRSLGKAEALRRLALGSVKIAHAVFGNQACRLDRNASARLRGILAAIRSHQNTS